MQMALLWLELMEPMEYMNGVHLSVCKSGRAICIFFFFLTRSLQSADLAIWTEPTPAVILAGKNKSVQLYIKNSAKDARKIRLETRTLQLGEKATPLGERKKWKEISIGAGQTKIEIFALELPTARVPATFLLKLYEEGNVVEAGSAPLLVYPEGIFGEHSILRRNQFAGAMKELTTRTLP
jgi:hypothetical protein